MTSIVRARFYAGKVLPNGSREAVYRGYCSSECEQQDLEAYESSGWEVMK